MSQGRGLIAGFVIGRIVVLPEAHILTLDVRPEMRRRNIGCILMDVIHGEFRLKGAKFSVLEVDVRNETARRFYEGLQYQYLEVLPGYYNGRSDAWRMICRF